MSLNQSGSFWDQPWWMLVLLASLLKLLWDLLLLPFFVRKKEKKLGPSAAYAFQEKLNNRSGVIVFAIVACGTILGALDANHVDIGIKNKVNQLDSVVSSLPAQVNNVLAIADSNRKTLSVVPKEFATKKTLRVCVSAVLTQRLHPKDLVPADCTLPP